MDGRYPVMPASRPVFTPETVPSEPSSPTTAFRLAPQNTNSQQDPWLKEKTIWARIRAQAFERFQRFQSDSAPPPTTASRPAILNNKGRRTIWIQESKEWSRGLAPKIERSQQQSQVETEKAEEQAETVPATCQEEESQEKTQAEIDTQGVGRAERL